MVASRSRFQRGSGVGIGVGVIALAALSTLPGLPSVALALPPATPSAAPSAGSPSYTRFGTIGSDLVTAVATAPNNDMYVAGMTTDRLSTDPTETNAGGHDVFVARVTSKGVVVWVRQFGSNDEDTATSITVSTAGDIFVGGFTEGGVSGPIAGGEDAFVARYDRKGNRRWIRQFGTAADDRVTSLATGWSGDLYVGGWTDGTLEGTSAGGRDAFLARYDARGKQRWFDQFGTTGNDAANAVAISTNRMLYVAGSTSGQFGDPGEGNPGTTDILLARYTRNGAPVWKHQYGTAGDDVASSVATDRYGRPFLTGTTTGSLAATGQGETDLFVGAMRTDGTPMWWRQQGTPDIERSNAIGFNRKGDVFVVGTTFGSLAANALGGGGDVLISHFGANGTPRWTKQFGTTGMDEATALTVARSGDLFVGGYSDGNLGGAGAGVKDGFLAHFDVRNDATWVHQSGTAGIDRVVGVAVPSSNDFVIAAGTTEGTLYGTSAGAADVFVVRHDVRNRRQGGWQFGTPAADEARAVAAGTNGEVVVVGRTEGSFGGAAHGNGDAFVARFTRTGRLLWVRQFGTAASDVATAVAVASNGDVFVAGNTAGSMSTNPAEANANDQDDIFLTKFDRYGRQRWLRQFGTPELDNVNAMALDRGNALYLGGTTIGSIATVAGEENREGFDGFVARYTLRGQVVWRHQFGSESTDIVYGISRNPRGGIDIAGLTGGTINEAALGGTDVFVGQYSAAGTLEWLHQFGTEFHDGAHAVASMPNGDISVVGFTDGALGNTSAGGTDMFVARYTRTGTRRWLQQFGTTADDIATSAVSQRAGQLFFGGYTGGSLTVLNAGSDDGFLARMG